MRISLLTREYPPAIYGGAGVHVGQLTPRLQKLIDVDVHCMGQDRPGASAHLENFPPKANSALRTFGADLSMVASLPEDIDLVHSHTWYANLAGLLGGVYRQIPHVITAHSLEPLRPWKREQLQGGYELSSWAERMSYEQADAIIAVSSAMRDDILTCYPQLDPDKVHVVLNGIDTEEFYPDDSSDFCNEIGMDISRPSVVFVGRITRQKGLVHLLRAARQLPAGVQIILLASSPDTEQIKEEFSTALDELKAAKPDDVIWISEMAPRSAVRQIISHATVFACPSVYEPLGIVNLEAMAAQTAVVASAVGGIPEVVVDQQTGLLVDYDPNRADDADYICDFEHRFAQALKELTDDPQRAKEMGKAGRQRCIDQFSWEKIAEETVKVYRCAIERYHKRTLNHSV